MAVGVLSWAARWTTAHDDAGSALLPSRQLKSGKLSTSDMLEEPLQVHAAAGRLCSDCSMPTPIPDAVIEWDSP
jgi:hypothetical protein